MSAAKMLRDLERDRVSRGVCRHCGGPVPCWSPYGDQAIGRKHTKAFGSRKRIKEAN